MELDNWVINGEIRTNLNGIQHPLYNTWNGIRQRCYTKTSVSYKNYGSKEVTMCDSWKDSFSNFVNDMGPRPEGCSIDRIDNSKGYSPENCKWSTRFEQNYNKSVTVVMEYQGKLYNSFELSELCGISPKTLRSKWKRGHRGDDLVNKFHDQKEVKYYSWEGNEYTMLDISKFLGCSKGVVKSRFRNGWSLNRIMTTPVISRNR